MRTTQVIRRSPRSTAVLGVLTLLAALMALWAPSSSAAPAGQVLASPDLTTYPQGDNSYPRAVRLDHDGSSGQTMLATFARRPAGLRVAEPDEVAGRPLRGDGSVS
ncbi:hypothetical protein [Streptomyces rochei]|uniref:hypothetical protein n=1 Tax=Streptomyces rochei TaxID=1928 RepID=UPI002949B09C|nr:hypothetical protein [Streptomyces sp. UP1A-1]